MTLDEAWAVYHQRRQAEDDAAVESGRLRNYAGIMTHDAEAIEAHNIIAASRHAIVESVADLNEVARLMVEELDGAKLVKFKPAPPDNTSHLHW